MPVTVLSAVRIPVRHVRERLHRMTDGFATLLRVTRILVDRLLHRSDYGRWSNPDSLETWWEARTKQLAQLIPKDSRVLEFGAGRRQLEVYLDPSCTYVPYDLVDRGPETLICDLNRRPLPDLAHVGADVAVFGGVLEYIRDVPGLLRWLADSGVKTCIASFDPTPPGLGIIRRYRESTRRTYYGYMNGLTEEELVRSFEAAGFARIQRQTWTTQVIFQFLRQP